MRPIDRREFLKQAAVAPAAIGLPRIVPAAALGHGAVAPSNKITLGCIGVGGMGTGNMKNFLGLDDCRVVAVCDTYEDRRQKAKDLVDNQYGDKGCAMYARLPRADRPQGHRRGDDRRAGPLARADRHGRRRGGQGHVLREADGRVGRAGPGILRRRAQAQARVPGRHVAAVAAEIPPRLRTGPQRLRRQDAHRPGRRARARNISRSTTARSTRSRCRPASIGRCGAARRRTSPTIPAASRGRTGI